MRLVVLAAFITIASGTELSPVDDAREKFYALELEIWKNVKSITSVWDTEREYNDETYVFIPWDDHTQSISTFIPQLKLKTWIWTKTLEQIQIINQVYKKFAEFIRKRKVRAEQWVQLATQFLDPKTSIPNALKTLDWLMRYGDKLLYESTQEDGYKTCTAAASHKKLIYDIYNTVAIAELKGYAVMQLSLMGLRTLKQSDTRNYTQEVILSREIYNRRSAQRAANAWKAMIAANKFVYMCDPLVHIEGKTYEQVTRLLQGYVENEVDMSETRSCVQNCAAYTQVERSGCYEEHGLCGQQIPCYGRIYDCKFIESDMAICLSSRNSNRRYDWIQYYSGHQWGEVGICPRGSTQVDSWSRWLFWQCSYCMCLCDDPTYSDRYFSLRESTSEIYNNKVVTGVRLVKHGRVFHLQVYEGTLKERGSVEPVDWVPVDKFDPSDFNINSGTDYHMLTYESRSLDLNEMEASTGSVLTGVRFRMVGDRLQLNIRATPFDYTTGRLSPDMSYWIMPSILSNKLELERPDIPTRIPHHVHKDSNRDQYIEFTHSDLVADAAQSTVPFIDVQPVLPSNGAALLSGAGVIHRGERGSGGFIALKLTMYPYDQHVWSVPPTGDFIFGHAHKYGQRNS